MTFEKLILILVVSKKAVESIRTTNAEIIVVIEAPMNPSQVFFGDNLINGVLPKKNPNI